MGDSLEERGGGGGEGADVDVVGEVGGGSEEGDGGGDGEDAGLADEGEVGEAEGLVAAGGPWSGEEGLGGGEAEVLEREWGGGRGGEGVF